MNSLDFNTTSDNLEQGQTSDNLQHGQWSDNGPDSVGSENTADDSFPYGPVDLVAEVRALRQAVGAEQERVAQLVNENTELKAQGLYRDQVHFLSLACVQREKDALLDRIDALTREYAYYQQRLESLEGQLIERNQDLQNAQTKCLNYEAVLSQLTKTEVENKAVTEQRDALHGELQETTYQARELVGKNEEMRDRLTDLQKTVVLLKNHSDEQVNAERENARFWQHRYECEFNQRYDDQQQQVTYNGQSVRGEQSGSTEALSDIVAPSSEVQAPPIYIPKPSQDTRTPSCDVNSPLRKKKRFEVGRSTLPHCKNCNTVFDMMKSPNSPCKFHLSPPQPYEPWRAEEDEAIALAPGRQPKYYWACCEKHGVQEPPGCTQLRNHDIVYPLDLEE